MESGVWPEALDLENFLGDPQVPTNPMAHEPSVRWDEEDAFPSGNVAALRDWGFLRYLVPRAHGGRLENCEQMLALTRVSARRDLTATITMGQTWLGSLPVWLSGERSKCRALSGHMLAGDLGCLALTEEAHGSDIMATETRAEPSGDSQVLSGSKWLINNATLGKTMVVLAATPGPGATPQLSLFFLEKDALQPGSFEHLPKIPTHGIRGADISGIRFQESPVQASAILGKPGDGFLMTLKTLQISRIQCAGFSLGAADTALRAALEFALDRRLYGGTVADIPAARMRLIAAYLDTLISECVALAASRAIHCLPGRLSLWSAATKYLVPTTVEGVIQECGVVFGARHFLRQGNRSGIFQKMMRDSAVVSFFDGSTAINSAIIAGQLSVLRMRRLKRTREEWRELAGANHRLFDLTHRVGSEHFVGIDDLEISNQGMDEIVDGLESVAVGLQPADDTERAIQELIGVVVESRRRFDDEVHALDRKGDVKPGSVNRFALAERYCQFVAAACCAALWFHNREKAGAFLGDGRWLVLCLARIVERLGEDPGGSWKHRSDALERVWCEMTDCVRDPRLFSLFPFPLAPDGSRSSRA